MGEIAILLGLVSALVLPLGLILASQASLGVAVVGAACWLAVAARLFQAAAHHRELIRRDETRGRVEEPGR